MSPDSPPPASNGTASTAPRPPAPAIATPEPARPRHAKLPLLGALAVLLGLATSVIWVSTGAGYYWPRWVWYGLGVPLALCAGLLRALEEPTPDRRRVGIHAAISGAIALAVVVGWLFTGGGFFWPVFPLLALAILGVLHALAVSERMNPQRERVLSERVDELTRTRRGVLDVQAAELRRIERDLHDGAQARLVALSIQLGRAEERLEDRPEAAELVRTARLEAAAIAELRDLSRGIAPPVLADRGLYSAIEALAQRCPSPVTVRGDLPRRPPPVVENAAYFIVAESLTNAVKHARGAAAGVRLELDARRLLVEVADEGPGGADPHGNGLTGLRQRVEALDGTLDVSTGAGGTTIRAELPCV